ncbi:MAG: ATP-dependent DNA helicase [bacterium]
MQGDEFEKRYSLLNTEQKEAVDAVEGPVMVVAGPGTGKTQILTLRIANILRNTDTNPGNILALTFTEAGVSTMRRRLLEFIGADAYSVGINTFHGFCNGVIKEYPEEFPRIIGSESITEVDQISLIEEIITSTTLPILKPFGEPLHHVRGILKAINDLKREGIDPEQFIEIIKKEKERFFETPDLYHEKGVHKGKMKGEFKDELKHIEKNEELCILYGAYEEKLSTRRMYDYGDMIMEVLHALTNNGDLLLILQEKHQYILVDEHQDTNNAQNKILELLANFHENPNIFVVGDEKQAIFRFQGASLQNFLHFKELYPEAKLIVLQENYRSSQLILDSAHSLIESKKVLHANTTNKNELVHLFEFSRPEVESHFLAEDIRKKLDAGCAPSDIAVLYRNNRDALPLVPELERAGVPFVIESDENVLSDLDIRKIIVLLRAINEFGEDSRVAEAMHIDFLKLDPLDVYRVIRASRDLRAPLYDVLRSEKVLRELNLENADAIKLFYGKLKELSVVGKNKGLQEFFGMVLRESGFLSYALGHEDMIQKMERVNGFFDEIQKLTERKPDTKLSEFLSYIATMEANKILIKKSSFSAFGNRVRLMTAHKSKGQEFEYVYMIGAFDGHWGNKKNKDSIKLPGSVFSLSQDLKIENNSIDDERRLFYVSLTRAKKSVTISYAKESISGREQLPTQFLSEMKAELIENCDTSNFEKEFSDHKELLFAPTAPSHASIKDKEFIRNLFAERGLSATALNNYLDCPWKYFYQNLIRIPSAKEPHQLFGTAIHAALDDFFSSFSEGGKSTKQYLLDRFAFHFDRQSFLEGDKADYMARGEKALSGYFDSYHATWATNVKTEFDVKGILFTPEIALSGKLDKLEFADDMREVNVVDYKTGKPKTRGVIEGTTESSNGNIKRQLVFYKILLDRYEKGKYHMVSADIDFVEPDDKGRYKKERFYVTDEEVSELSDTITRVVAEIHALSFWETRCGEEKCEFCKLRDMMG